MDGLVEELLRLEDAKHKALVEINASAYDDCVREQMHALSNLRTANVNISLERLLALSQLIQINKRLLQNLVSTTPWFAFNQNGYTQNGAVATSSKSGRVFVEA